MRRQRGSLARNLLCWRFVPAIYLHFSVEVWDAFGEAMRENENVLP